MISIEDLILVPLYLIVIIGLARLIKSNNINKYPEYKYFLKGLWFKIIGVSAFISVYLFYYGGGDTLAYFRGAKCLGNLLVQDFSKGLAVLFNTDSYENSYSSFNYETGFPHSHYFANKNTFLVCRLSAPLYLLGSKSFLITSFLTSVFSYIGIWKFYRLVNILYPGHAKSLAYIILFMPSLVFWGGGIMKDSYMLGATCWVTYSFFYVFIARKKVFWNICFLILNTVMVLNCKPYILISLIPGFLFWINNYLKSVKNKLIRILIFPAVILIFIASGSLIFNSLSGSMGVYGSVEGAIKKAQITQDDLLNERQYGGNNYKLDRIDGSISGLVGSAPLAIFTALFRPLPWEIGSPTMVVSAIENTVLIIFILYSLIRIGPFRFFRITFNDPFLVYCLIFSLFFAFGVGIAGTNFGALVRYKIPLMPFFFSFIYIIRKKSFI